MPVRKNADGKPQILAVTPPAAIAGGEFQIRGKGFAAESGGRPRVTFGEVEASVVIASDSQVIARVPEGASVGELTVRAGEQVSTAWTCELGIPITESVHPVSNPAVDAQGNIYTTLSGPRGQATPVSVYKIDLNYNLKPFISDVMNATGLTFDKAGDLYISSRHNGVIYKVTPSGQMSVYVEGMGIATGLAFDQEGNLYVGDRQGTVFKISQERQIYVFATLEPSHAAYHLAFGPEGYLYVTGPTMSTHEAVFRISPAGSVETFYRGLGRLSGLAFDVEGRLYVAASLSGRRGVVRIGEDRKPEMFVSGPGIVGLAFTPSRSVILAISTSPATGALYRIDAGIEGRPIP